ncbi:MAG TPA: ATP-dependent DNA helicase RecG [Candidatus Baltobacteraceae bacterium]|nr:ATP-dependent DNA helicase RecG [Candidatus Baltobacteraceae bacterium]
MARPAAAPPAPPGPDTPLARSGLVAPAQARRLARLGLQRTRDLLFHLPRRYDDFTHPRSLRSLREDPPQVPVSSTVTVVELHTERTFRRRVEKTTARLRDASGEGEAVWFGRRFIDRRLKVGDEIAVSGRVVVRGWLPQYQGPDFGPVGGAALHAGRIVPVYRLTEGVSPAALRTAMRRALDAVGRHYPDYLDGPLLAEASIGESAALPPLPQALEQAHYPDDFGAHAAAMHRLAFDELLALQIGMVARDRQRRGLAGPRVGVTDDRLEAAVTAVEGAITATLARRGETAPARLTDDQRAAVAAIRRDLAGPRPMLRLLQGDVGSGKTAVAALALAFVADSGAQGALLAPTDLLARQHAATLRGLLEPLGHRVELLTASLPAAERQAVLGVLASPPAGPGPDGLTAGRVVVGTHALLSAGTAFADLALAVVDEQHRFGVAQREALAGKGRTPHVLLMTATPIPRTLGQVFHADLDVSDLRSAPAGRKRVVTGTRGSGELMQAGPDPTVGTWPLVVTEVAAGHRAFVIVPLVEEGEGDAARSVDQVADELGGWLAEAAHAAGRPGGEAAPRIGRIHGQLPAPARDSTMEAFRRGDLDVLVGTTVLEVGVDVPEATVMVVLDADRFGLAQLHQLRGRVGRGPDRAYCILVSDTDDPVARARLQALVDTQDGFVLAERDLELRAEGDLLGLLQSGLPPLRVARLQAPEDRARSQRARAIAERLVTPDGTLVPGHEALAHELAAGWLKAVGAGEALAGDERTEPEETTGG